MNLAVNDDGAGFDFSLEAGVFTDGEISIRADFAFDLTIDNEVVGEFDGALDVDIRAENVARGSGWALLLLRSRALRGWAAAAWCRTAGSGGRSWLRRRCSGCRTFLRFSGLLPDDFSKHVVAHGAGIRWLIGVKSNGFVALRRGLFLLRRTFCRRSDRGWSFSLRNFFRNWCLGAGEKWIALTA